jgi:hypothetical protein
MRTAGDIPGLDFKSVMHVLGPGWREDRRAEIEWQVARAEPFNPPPPPVTGFMGDAIMSYASRPEIQLSITFGSSGRLEYLNAIWPKMPGEEKSHSTPESDATGSPERKAAGIDW